MKTLNILLVLIIISAQFASAQKVFTDVVIDQYHSHKAISFTVPSEANVSHYRVLAGNDTTNLEILGNIYSGGNSLFARDYHYEIYEPLYTYYRIALICMDGKLKYSPVVTAQEQEVPKSPFIKTSNYTAGSVLVKSH